MLLTNVMQIIAKTSPTVMDCSVSVIEFLSGVITLSTALPCERNQQCQISKQITYTSMIITEVASLGLSGFQRRKSIFDTR